MTATALKDDKIVAIGSPVYNVLHGEPDATAEGDAHKDDIGDDDNEHDSHALAHKKHEHKQEQWESFDFQDFESIMWRKVIFEFKLDFIFNACFDLIFMCVSINTAVFSKTKDIFGLRAVILHFGDGF